MKRGGLLTTENGKAALFLCLALPVNLCACYLLHVGVKYVVGVAVMGWAALDFAVRPDFGRAKHYLKYFLLFYFPFLLFWVWSLALWIGQFQTVDYIVRGSLNTVYMATAVGYAVGSFYLLGVRAAYLNFYAMCLANAAALARTVLAYGPGQVLAEFITLLTSFANETGPAMSALELHDMVFGFGVYVLFFLLHRKDGKLRLGHLLLACFFFVLALKRVAVIAVLLPLAVMAGTFAVTALAGLFLPLGPKDCVAAAAGFGWYSLAPTLLAPYSLTVSATAFLSNIMHELFSIVAVPVVAKKLGYIEAVALPGATAMDTVLPVVVSATCDRMAIYSFASGVILSLSVPVLIPAIIALPF